MWPFPFFSNGFLFLFVFPPPSERCAGREIPFFFLSRNWNDTLPSPPFFSLFSLPFPLLLSPFSSRKSTLSQHRLPFFFLSVRAMEHHFFPSGSRKPKFPFFFYSNPFLLSFRWQDNQFPFSFFTNVGTMKSDLPFLFPFFFFRTNFWKGALFQFLSAKKGEKEHLSSSLLSPLLSPAQRRHEKCHSLPSL